MSHAFLGMINKHFDKTNKGSIFRVISNKWTHVGRTVDFPLQQPKVVFLRNSDSNSVASRPLYVLQRRQGKFIVVDMNSLGKYESRISGEHIYIRRLLSMAEED